MIRGRTGIAGEGSKLLDRAEAYPVCLAQGSVDRPRFGDPHLSPMDHEGNIGRIRVAVTSEPFRTRGLVDGCFEYPAVSSRIAKTILYSRLYSKAMPPLGYMEQARMRDVPPILQELQISCGDRKSEFVSQLPQRLKRKGRKLAPNHPCIMSVGAPGCV